MRIGVVGVVFNMSVIIGSGVTSNEDQAMLMEVHDTGDLFVLGSSR